MNLIRRDPKRDPWAVSRPLNAMFDDFFAPFFNDRWDADLTQWQPVVDVMEEDGQYRVKAELPGMKKENIKVDVKGNMLTLRGERSEEKTDEKERYFRRERRFGSFTRSFALPENVDSETIKADYKDGVLNIVIPKPEGKMKKKITVQ
ncbi:MAG: Hsp20/alpha crystallin family protein [Desulfosarcinaceae bacterium]|jgi:HSP20 family protein